MRVHRSSGNVFRDLGFTDDEAVRVKSRSGSEPNRRRSHDDPANTLKYRATDHPGTYGGSARECISRGRVQCRRVGFTAPDGTHLGSLETGVAIGNYAWGDDGSSLYVAANTAILRVKLTTKGVGF